MTLFFLDLESVFFFLRIVMGPDKWSNCNISRVLPMQMKKLTWLAFAVSFFAWLSSRFIILSLDLNRIQDDAAVRNSPVWFGGISVLLLFPPFLAQSICNFFFTLEWALSTEFSASDRFLKQWADAQKFAYANSTGWFVSHFFLPSSLPV